LGGVNREHLEPVEAAPLTVQPRSNVGVWVAVVLIGTAAVALWRYQPEIRGLLAGALPSGPPAAEVPSRPEGPTVGNRAAADIAARHCTIRPACCGTAGHSRPVCNEGSRGPSPTRGE
jgi:hypothetical protein